MGSANALGSDTILSSCTLPSGSQYISTNCYHGSAYVVGSVGTISFFLVYLLIHLIFHFKNSAVSDCSLPGASQYISNQCQNGFVSGISTIMTLGKNASKFEYFIIIKT